MAPEASATTPRTAGAAGAAAEVQIARAEGEMKAERMKSEAKMRMK
jgi:hypothetical protein